MLVTITLRIIMVNFKSYPEYVVLQFCNVNKVDHLLEILKPKHYELNIWPDKEQLTFSGSVIIYADLLKPTYIVKLHTKGIKITRALFSIGASEHKFSNLKYAENDELMLVSPVEISGEIILKLEFNGDISESMVGLYPCKHKVGLNEIIILATQFESHHAREVFPCIDEPAAKATFDLTLTTSPNETVLSNTPIVFQTKSAQNLITVFKTTPVMSTYLLAFVVGQLEFLESKAKDGTIVRTWATKDNVGHTKFALDVAVRTLDFFADYFAVPYPLDKCDHVALPDFAAGAMENWGLITYRDSGLIVDDKNTPLEDKQYTALVIAHEVAHQWFGNLVTMKWWNDLWLNEGFASWIEYLAVDNLFPEWQIWNQFVFSETLSAQSLDSLINSHPIEVSLENPEDIRSIFDSISYSKGASIIRMLYSYLGEDNFRQGLTLYLRDNSYSNTETTDLWQALEEISNKPVSTFMSAWTKQTGFPLVQAKFIGNSIQLKQHRFLINPQAKQENVIWPIPISVTNVDQTFLFDQAETSWQIEAQSNLKLNLNHDGFYLIQYDQDYIDKLGQMLVEGQFQPLDRIGLLSDTWQLTKGGYSSTIIALNFLSKFNLENNVFVWDLIASQIGSLRNVFGSEQLDLLIQPYLKNLIIHEFERLGWITNKNDNHFDKLLRPVILALASRAGINSVIEEAKNRFAKANSPQDIEPDLRSLIFNITARHGSNEDYQKILKMYLRAGSSQVKNQLSGALCSFGDPTLIAQSIELLISDKVKLQEILYWISSLFANRYAKNLAWDWLKENWHWLEVRFGNDIMTFSYLPKLAGRAFAHSRMIDEYQSFFNSIDSTGIKQPIAQGLETIYWQSAWHERDEKIVLEYFENYKNSTKT